MGNSCNFIHAEPKTFDVQSPEVVVAMEVGDLKTENMPDQSDFNALINKAPCMVFMKGKPAEPLCELSRTLIGILWEAKLSYEHFDILSDKHGYVHEGLKKLSNCMTYPQVFVNGVFIGNLDVIKKLKESGDLVEKLKI